MCLSSQMSFYHWVISILQLRGATNRKVVGCIPEYKERKSNYENSKNITFSFYAVSNDANDAG